MHEMESSVLPAPSGLSQESGEELTYEQALTRLESIVRSLESGQLTLDESLKLFQMGIGMVRLCEKMLDVTEAKIEVLTRSTDGNHTLLPFEAGDEA